MLPSLLILAGGGAVADLPDLHMSPSTAPRAVAPCAWPRQRAPVVARIQRSENFGRFLPAAPYDGPSSVLRLSGPLGGLSSRVAQGAKENNGGLLTGGGGF
jgi:hypothetical protein